MKQEYSTSRPAQDTQRSLLSETCNKHSRWCTWILSPNACEEQIIMPNPRVVELWRSRLPLSEEEEILNEQIGYSTSTVKTMNIVWRDYGPAIRIELPTRMSQKKKKRSKTQHNHEFITNHTIHSQRHINTKNQIDVLYIDFTKAFDRINHCIFAKKWKWTESHYHMKNRSALNRQFTKDHIAVQSSSLQERNCVNTQTIRRYIVCSPAWKIRLI